MAAPPRGPLSGRATGAFSVNVKLPPRNDTGSAHATRFQYKAPPLLMGELIALTCQPGCTVSQLKAMLKEKTGVQAEWLRAGGSRTGEVLQDSSTLEACGLGYDMSPWEYLWIDSEANQRTFAEEVEKVEAFITTQRFDVGKDDKLNKAIYA